MNRQMHPTTWLALALGLTLAGCDQSSTSAPGPTRTVRFAYRGGTGEYTHITANGVPVDVTKDPWAAVVGTAGQEITLTVSSEPEMTDAARDVVIKPIGGEGRLRYRAWIERNRAYVDEQTDGQNDDQVANCRVGKSVDRQ